MNENYSDPGFSEKLTEILINYSRTPDTIYSAFGRNLSQGFIDTEETESLRKEVEFLRCKLKKYEFEEELKLKEPLKIRTIKLIKKCYLKYREN